MLRQIESSLANTQTFPLGWSSCTRELSADEYRRYTEECQRSMPISQLYRADRTSTNNPKDSLRNITAATSVFQEEGELSEVESVQYKRFGKSMHNWGHTYTFDIIQMHTNVQTNQGSFGNLSLIMKRSPKIDLYGYLPYNLKVHSACNKIIFGGTSHGDMY